MCFVSFSVITARKQCCGKAIFSQASVSHSGRIGSGHCMGMGLYCRGRACWGWTYMEQICGKGCACQGACIAWGIDGKGHA